MELKKKDRTAYRTNHIFFIKHKATKTALFLNNHQSKNIFCLIKNSDKHDMLKKKKKKVYPKLN